MRIGITFDLKGDAADGPVRDAASVTALPDDWEEEFDSPVTIEAIAAVLRGLGHDVVLLGDGRPMLEKLLAAPPDFVFNLAEGRGACPSREARVPAVLDLLGVPYSGSGPLTLAVALDKDCTRQIVAGKKAARLPLGFTVEPQDVRPRRDVGLAARPPDMRWPWIVKPAWEGSSKGVRSACLVRDEAAFADLVPRLARDYRQPLLVEEFIAGDEVTVGVVGNEAPQVIGMMRILPVEATPHFVYSLEVKRDYLRQVKYECPPRLPDAATQALAAAALAVYRALGCRDLARVDFRLGADGLPYFLEINPLPGVNPESSDLVIMTRLLGWSYDRLIRTVLETALRRCGLLSA